MKRSKSLKNILFAILVTCIIVIWISPILFILLTSVKSTSDFFNKPVFSLPSTLRLQNFLEAWSKGSMSQYMMNSIIVTFIKVPLGVFLEAITAFALTRLQLKHKNAIFIVFLIGMMIPMQVTLVPLNLGLTKLHMINTFAGLILVYLGFGLPFGILVMRGFFNSIPAEIDESARLDGCSNIRLFWNILLPIARPAVATLFILDFLSSWNEFLFSSLLITKDRLRTIPSGLMSFFGEFGTNYPLFTAGVLISIIPIMVVYIFCQRYFVEGMAGAVKG